ncbi:MAG: ABC transporter permease/M1 family aminopeptidase [Longimicrobiales bacterium]
MFWATLRFEVFYHLRRPVTYLYAVVLFLLAFAFISSEQIGPAGGLLRRNSPFVLTQIVLVLTAVGQVITTAIVGGAVLRDYNYRTHELLFTTRISRWGYLGGRFFGAVTVMALVYAAIPLGAMLGTFMPWIDPDKMLPFQAWHYVQPFLLFGLTNVLFVSALFFAVGALTRNIFAIYTQGILLLVAWSVTQQWLNGLDNDTMANALDAFGLATLDLTTRYWTVVEKNAQLLSLNGVVLTNRLIWMGVSVLLLAATVVLFRFEAAPRRLGWRRRARAGVKSTAPPAQPSAAPAAAPDFGRSTPIHQLASMVRFSFLRIVRDIPFLAISAIGAIDLFMNSWYADQLYGVTVWPVTYTIAETVSIDFVLFMIILTTIYAGESIWRERALGSDQIADALPVATPVTAAGKIVGVILSQALLLVIFMLVGMLAQTVKGYFQYEPMLYLQFLFGATLPWMIAVTLFAFAVHALVDHKFMGHVVLIVYWLGTIVLSTVGLEHQIYSYGMPPDFTYSDMNGFGHFIGNLIVSAGYWNAVGLMLATLALLAWRRGTEAGWRLRWQEARQRWPATRLYTGGTALASIALGGFLFYNTNVLNQYRTEDDGNEELARWERDYRRFQHLAPPRIVAVEVQVDLQPERREATVRGQYLVRNQQAVAIDSVFVNWDPDYRRDSLYWDRSARLAIEDTVTGSQLFVLAQPLAPGDSMVLRYQLHFQAQGFPNSGPNNRIVANGTFLPGLGPSLGYDDNAELSDADERKKQKLPSKERLPDLDDPTARANSQFAIDSDEIRFAATISTSPDQIAVAPGYLEREWTENGRRFFRYVMDRPIANFATVVSARYAVRRDRWQNVDIEIYHHPTHTFNTDRMVDAVKASLDYYTTHFGPYQHRMVRILEFPRYAAFAQSFPGTVPYSEQIGFILRVRDKDDDLDMPLFVTAHEVAHQWWGHQVVGARAQGSALMVESMAEYSALTVMEQRYGQSHVQKFLRHELDRYLGGRSVERRKEQPLIRTENQAYIHYNKGALVLYALRDYIGEEAMNRAVRGYLQAHAHERAPYSTARDFVAALRQQTPDSLQSVVTDLFETITLFDNQTEDARVTRRPDGTYSVQLDVSTHKFRADSLGAEQEVPISDYIDVGVFGEKEKGNALGKPLYVKKHRITGPRTTIEVVVPELPRKAGIDPYNKLIDRVPGDNVKELGRPEQ